MENVALVTILLLVQYKVFQGLAGAARGKGDIKAPAMTGDEAFERKSRVQLNTLENLVITLPAMWLCAHYYRADAAAILGIAFFVGRAIYSMSYVKDPARRGLGMMIGYLANVAMMLATLYGIFF